jgi:hypothetical protein
VYEKEVNVVKAELRKAAVARCDGGVVSVVIVVQLRRHEQL